MIGGGGGSYCVMAIVAGYSAVVQVGKGGGSVRWLVGNWGLSTLVKQGCSSHSRSATVY